MRVTFYMHQIHDRAGDGGMIALWRLLDGIAARGCEVTVAAAARTGDETANGWPIVRSPGLEVFADADLVLVAGKAAARNAVAGVRESGSGARVVEMIHSVTNLEPVVPGVDHVIWASRAMREYARQNGVRPESDSVVWPLIDPAKVSTTAGDRVTLVNLIPEKGGDLFWQVAERMPDVRFLAVRGGWRNVAEVIPDRIPANVEVLDFQADPREVYRRTKILLYPKGGSASAGWLHGVGMTALEAACSGIPTIASRGPGLVESLGESGTFMDTMDLLDWCAAIAWLLDRDVYGHISDRALRRAQLLDPSASVDAVLSLARSPEPVAA